jgi:methylthioribulose-1-phosphate dehydratase
VPRPSPSAALPSYPVAARRLADIGRRFYARGWVTGTSGNLSAVVSRSPLRLAITASSVPKGALTARQILEVDADARPVRKGALRPSAETLLHGAIVRARGAGAVLHTHSVWSTILTDRLAGADEVEIAGFEMLKGFAGVRTHEHVERVPILENDQEMTRLAGVVTATLAARPAAHALLLRRHGLYTWGATLDEAERHVEIAEFLFEVRCHGFREHSR